MGFWTRANPELCLLATRGKPQRRATDVAKLLIEAAARAFAQARRDLRTASSAWSTGPISSCSRAPRRPGWDRLGNQAGLFDQGPVRTRRRPSRGPAPAPAD